MHIPLETLKLTTSGRGLGPKAQTDSRLFEHGSDDSPKRTSALTLERSRPH